MGYRQIYIKNANKLGLKDNNIVVYQDEKISRVPLEDTNFILLDSYKTVITARLLSEISKHYISLIICDEKHEPSTLTYCYNQHYKQLDIFDKQINVDDELNSELWAKIIRFKILNQLQIVREFADNEKSIDLLSSYINEIKLDDITNREGLAAKVFFRSIFGSEFIRFYNDAINSALNYGYSIIKTAIVRSLVSHGLVTYIGIHHKSKTNNFNLAYDLIEPYRCVIDKYVYLNQDRITMPLSFEIRKELVNILNERVLINNKEYTVQFSIDVMIESYIESISKNKNLLNLPCIITP